MVVGTNFLRLVDCAMQSIYPNASMIVYFSVVESISKLKKQQERLQREAEEVRKREFFCCCSVSFVYIRSIVYRCGPSNNHNY